MLQLILHGVGDYYLQTDHQALNKKKRTLYGLQQCLIHCVTYSLPFLLIGSWKAVLVIFVTHFIIDRYNIVSYLLAIKNGVYVKNDIPGYEDLIGRRPDISNFGFSPERPFAITVWLFFISDNLLHIIINYFALIYL